MVPDHAADARWALRAAKKSLEPPALGLASMSNESDRRPMVAVPPPQRPLRRRRAARVVVRAAGRVLLMADSDPGLPGSGWWVTPGGGLDIGETSRQAAARELAEETGLRVSAADLVGPIAYRVLRHGYSDQVLVQQEDFYALDLPAIFTPDSAGFTPEEQVTLSGFHWFTAEELGALLVWPAELARLVADATSSQPIDFGEVEESTVPVALGHR